MKRNSKFYKDKQIRSLTKELYSLYIKDKHKYTFSDKSNYNILGYRIKVRLKGDINLTDQEKEYYDNLIPYAFEDIVTTSLYVKNFISKKSIEPTVRFRPLGTTYIRPLVKEYDIYQLAYDLPHEHVSLMKSVASNYKDIFVINNTFKFRKVIDKDEYFIFDIDYSLFELYIDPEAIYLIRQLDSITQGRIKYLEDKLKYLNPKKLSPRCYRGYYNKKIYNRNKHKNAYE